MRFHWHKKGDCHFSSPQESVYLESKLLHFYKMCKSWQCKGDLSIFPCINDTFPFQTVTIYGKKFRGHLKTVAQFFYFQFFIRRDVHQHFLIKAGQFRPDFTVNIFFQILVVFWEDIFYVFTIPIFPVQISQNLKRKRIAFR